MKTAHKGKKWPKTDLQYVKFLKKLLSVHVFVAEDFTLEIILCTSFQSFAPILEKAFFCISSLDRFM